MEKATGRGIYSTTALLLVLQFLLLTMAIVVLGAVIDWPASLDEPAGIVLPAITEQRDAVLVGYGAYMLYSILFVPLALLLYHVLAGRGVQSPLLVVAATFGVVSALARALGIVRWFVLMPSLAETYLDPRASEATRASVSLVYEAFNDYAGSVGEILGVQLFGGLFIGLVSVAMVRTEWLPSWIGYAGLVVALLLLSGILEILGLDLGVLLTISVTALQFWMLALAIVLVMRSRRSSRWAA
jgi:hypothetical protein